MNRDRLVTATELLVRAELIGAADEAVLLRVLEILHRRHLEVQELFKMKDEEIERLERKVKNIRGI